MYMLYYKHRIIQNLNKQTMDTTVTDTVWSIVSIYHSHILGKCESPVLGIKSRTFSISIWTLIFNSLTSWTLCYLLLLCMSGSCWKRSVSYLPRWKTCSSTLELHTCAFVHVCIKDVFNVFWCFKVLDMIIPQITFTIIVLCELQARNWDSCISGSDDMRLPEVPSHLWSKISNLLIYDTTRLF